MGLSILHTGKHRRLGTNQSAESLAGGGGRASHAKALELSPEVWEDTGGRKLSWPETGGGFVKRSELAPQPRVWPGIDAGQVRAGASGTWGPRDSIWTLFTDTCEGF